MVWGMYGAIVTIGCPTCGLVMYQFDSIDVEGDRLRTQQSQEQFEYWKENKHGQIGVTRTQGPSFWGSGERDPYEGGSA